MKKCQDIKRKRRKRKVFGYFYPLCLLFRLLQEIKQRALNHRIHGTLNLMTHDDSGVIANVENELAGALGNVEKSNDVINILLVGADKRSSWKEDGRSDSCMIATIDKKMKK